MLPLRQQPPLTSLAGDPAQERGLLDTLTANIRDTRASLHHYRPTVLATEDGRLMNVLAMPAEAANLGETPPEHYTPRPGVEFAAPADLRALMVPIDARALAAYSSTHTWQPFTQTNDGTREVEALAQYLGPTEAVPFRAHWLPSSRVWLCIGGKFTQNGTQRTVATTRLQIRSSGLLGLTCQLSEGWIITQAPVWTALEAGSPPSVSNPASCFIPLFAVKTSPVRAIALPFQLPVSSGPWAPHLNPSGATGTLLP